MDKQQIAQFILDPPGCDTLGSPRRDANRYEWVSERSVEDPEYFKLVSEVHTRLQDVVPVEEEPAADGTFEDSCNTERFDRLGALFSRGYRPFDRNPYDARKVRDTLPNYRDPDDDMRLCIGAVLDRTTPSGYKSRPYSINKYSSSGAPMRSRDPAVKTGAILRWCRHSEHMMELITQNRLVELRERYGMVNVNMPGTRSQADMPGKKRKVYTMEGVFVDADYSLPPQLMAKIQSSVGSTSVQFRRARERAISSISDANAPIGNLAADTLDKMRDVYPFTFKHAGRLHVENKARIFKFMRRYDFGKHELRFHPDFFAAQAALVATRYSPSIALGHLMALRSPQLVLGTNIGSTDWELLGTPWDLDGFKARMFLPSGVRTTSSNGNQWTACNALEAAARAGLAQRTVEGADALFSGTGRVAVLIAGDNLVTLSNDEAAINAFDASLRGMEWVEIGPSNSFLGYVFKRVDGELRAYPNPLSMVYNLLMPGRSAHDEQKGDAVAGSYDRMKYYEDAPYSDVIRKVLVEALWDISRIMYGVQRLADKPSADVEPYYNRIAAILEENPDAIHYKVDGSALPAALRDMVYLTVPSSENDRMMAGIRAFDSVAANRDRAHHWIGRLLSDFN